MKFRIFLISLSLVFAATMQSAESYNDILGAVDQCFKNQDWEKAETLIKQALQLEPGNPSNYLLMSNLGTVHRNRGDLQAALADYNAALQIAPKSTTILHNRASLFLDMDSTKNAFSDYRRLVEINPRDLVAKNYIGIIAMEFGNMDLAKQSFNDVLAEDKDNLDAKRGLALYSRLTSNFDTAVALYNEIIEKENRLSNYLNRAECYLAVTKLTEAQSDLLEAQKLDPKSPDLFLLKARLAQLQYQYDDAANYAKQAVALGCDPELAEPFFRKN